MKAILARHGYIFDEDKGIWRRQDFDDIAYSDGDEVENRLFDIISKAKDLSVLSDELKPHCTDWPSLYHLSSSRANILRPFEEYLSGDILEIGSGLGAITRFLGECGGNVLALEGTSRRAMIARSRTRDLENVTVLNEKFENFNIDQKFDVITLIGVLEYANLFTSSETPAVTMLEMVRKLLKPDGKLIIAIENQLGLKYFAGAPEDHIGQAMYGIEGRYTKNQPQTYGRKVLNDMLTSAGFKTVDFLAPFPDYKLPVSIVTEEGFMDEDFDASAFAIQSVKKDPQLPNVLNFSQELTWGLLEKNKIALDMSNSFLVFATNKKIKKVAPKTYAWHFTSSRFQKYCKSSRFIKNKTEINIETYRLNPNYSDVINDSFVINRIEKYQTYFSGELLSIELIEIFSKDNWTKEAVKSFLLKYISALENILGNEIQVKPTFLLPPHFIDCIPQNIIQKNAKFVFFDREWESNKPIHLGYLIFRTMIAAQNQISAIGKNYENGKNTKLELIKLAMQSLGWQDNNQTLMDYIALEYQLQKEVGFLNFNLDEYVLNFDTPASVSINKDQQINQLQNEIAENHKAALNKDQQINQILLSKSWRVTSPLRFINKALRTIFRSFN